MGLPTDKEPEGIGHITTPVKDLAHTKRLLEPHGVIITPRLSCDGWYTLVLPQGSTSKAINEEREISEISLPDGYRFRYIPPVFHSAESRWDEKRYEREPEILLT